VICIDVEPDPRVVDRSDPPPWLGFERMLERLPGLRQRLSEATDSPAAFTWFLRMDPQVATTWGTAGWVVERYEKAIAELSEAGDELALHAHTWRWDEGANDWIGEFADPAWEEHCVGLGLESFRAALGRDCRAHRGGDHFLSGTMLACLQAAGVRVDLTVEPGLSMPRMPADGQVHGVLPDYRRVPATPYRSSRARFPEPDPHAPAETLLVPLLSAPGRWPPLRRTPVRLASPGTSFVPALGAALLRRPPVVALAMRTHLAAFPEWSLFERNVTRLARRRGVFFTTASAAAELLEDRLDQPASSPPPSSAGSARGPSG